MNPMALDAFTPYESSAVCFACNVKCDAIRRVKSWKVRTLKRDKNAGTYRGGEKGG